MQTGANSSKQSELRLLAALAPRRSAPLLLYSDTRDRALGPKSRKAGGKSHTGQ